MRRARRTADNAESGEGPVFYQRLAYLFVMGACFLICALIYSSSRLAMAGAGILLLVCASIYAFAQVLKKDPKADGNALWPCLIDAIMIIILAVIIWVCHAEIADEILEIYGYFASHELLFHTSRHTAALLLPSIMALAGVICIIRAAAADFKSLLFGRRQ